MATGFMHLDFIQTAHKNFRLVQVEGFGLRGCRFSVGYQVSGNKVTCIELSTLGSFFWGTLNIRDRSRMGTTKRSKNLTAYNNKV